MTTKKDLEEMRQVVLSRLKEAKKWLDQYTGDCVTVGNAKNYVVSSIEVLES